MQLGTCRKRRVFREIPKKLPFLAPQSRDWNPTSHFRQTETISRGDLRSSVADRPVRPRTDRAPAHPADGQPPKSQAFPGNQTTPVSVNMTTDVVDNSAATNYKCRLFSSLSAAGVSETAWARRYRTALARRWQVSVRSRFPATSACLERRIARCFRDDCNFKGGKCRHQTILRLKPCGGQVAASALPSRAGSWRSHRGI